MEMLSWQSSMTWRTATAADARLELGQTSGGIRFDWHLPIGGGFAVARLPADVSVPGRFRIWLRWRGRGAVETLECKLVSDDGGSVWWARQHQLDLAASSEWCIESHEFVFAWGAAGGGRPGQLSAIELAFVGSQAASGEMELFELRIEDLSWQNQMTFQVEWPASERPLVSGSLPLSDHGISLPGAQVTLSLHPQASRPSTGLLLVWVEGDVPDEVTVEGRAPDDATQILVPRRAIGRRVLGLYWPSQILQSLNLQFERDALVGGVTTSPRLARIEWLGPEQVASLEELVTRVAAEEVPGRFPAALNRRQIDWTVLGAPECPFQALFGLDGRVEARPGGPSVEPFLHDGRRWLSWADGEAVAGWQEGRAPLPQVDRVHDRLRLRIEAVAVRSPRWGVQLRYRATYCGADKFQGALAIALRPYQVSPPWQHWRKIGGLSALRCLSWSPEGVNVSGEMLADGHLALRTLTQPDVVYLQAWGDTAWLDRPLGNASVSSAVPTTSSATRIDDPDGLAEAALIWSFALAPGQTFEQGVFIPFEALPPAGFVSIASDSITPDSLAGRFADARADWTHLQARWPEVKGPEAAQHLWLAARTAACHLLINRDGPMLQPGPRRYTRSWIRDGVTMAAALLRLGENDAVAAFLDGFTPAILPSGFVPCCIDREGVDPLVEHDSHGQWIHLLAEYHRFSQDGARLAGYRETLYSVVDHLLQLIEPETGLLPPSVSHEGYLARPVHAFWDDAWALRGLQDAEDLLMQLEAPERAQRCQQAAAELARSMRRSVDDVMTRNGLHELPGSVEWADFDPTATACAIGQLGLAAIFDSASVHQTFDRFLLEWRQRIEKRRPADRYSAYEIRNAHALSALGRGDEALEQLQYALTTARPVAWQQWPEITWIESGVPGHMGDLPHTWIAAEFLLAVRSLWLVEEPRRLVFGRGLPSGWLDRENLALLDWPTPFGRLSLRTRLDTPDSMLLELDGDVIPPEGLLLSANAFSGWQMERASASVQSCADGYRVVGTPISLRWRRSPNDSKTQPPLSSES